MATIFRPPLATRVTAKRPAHSIYEAGGTNLLLTTLAVAAIQSPFALTNWPLPAKLTVLQPEVIANRLPLTSVPVISPFFQSSLSDQPRKATPQPRSEWPNLQFTTLADTNTYQVRESAFAPRITPRIAQPTHVVPNLLESTLLVPLAAPFRQNDFPNPQTVFNSAPYRQIVQQYIEGIPPYVPPVVAPTTLGAPDARPPRRFSAEINGKFYYFDSIAELQTVLDSFKRKQKKNIVKIVNKRVIEVQLPHVDPPVHIPVWAVKEIERTNASLEAYYWAQVEILNNNDEDDAIVALYG